MKTYIKTQWEDGKTPVNASNMMKIENALEDLYLQQKSICPGDGIKITATEEGEKKISHNLEAGNGIKLEVTESGAVKLSTKIKVIMEEQESYDQETLYFLVDKNTGAVTRIMYYGME